jgi:hypothetical protein
MELQLLVELMRHLAAAEDRPRVQRRREPPVLDAHGFLGL